MRSSVRSLFVGFMCLFSAVSHAQVTIDIVGGGQEQRPLVVAPFLNESGSLPLTNIIRSDLQRSGGFRSSQGQAPYPNDATGIQYNEFRTQGVESVVVGGIYPKENGLMEVRVRLYSVDKTRELGAKSYIARPAQFRLTAHKIADWVYEQLTGHVGVFSTRVAYVLKKGKRFELQVADTDAFNPQTPFASNEPILSPRWSPDGTHLAYVSFESKKPVVYVQSLSNGQRRAVASFKGSNSAPAWFPDGRSLAVVLTKDGTSQIYRVFLDGRPIERLTRSNSIDTEPDVSPDAQSILFVSDRGGSPQIYKLDVSSGSVSRQSFEGSYNVSPHFSPDGKSFVFIYRDGGRFTVAIQDINSKQIQRLTRGPSDESPGFAPNGQFVLYAAKEGRRDILMATSLNGSKYQLQDIRGGNLREPAWSPIAKK
ncbi:MAG: Tol-Pal system beta propeller repeat protein TolB [Pseudomonadota bacterium]